MVYIDDMAGFASYPLIRVDVDVDVAVSCSSLKDGNGILKRRRIRTLQRSRIVTMSLAEVTPSTRGNDPGKVENRSTGGILGWAMNGLSMFQFRKDDTKDLVTAKPSSTSKLPNQRVAEVGSKQPQQGGQPSPKKNTPRDVGGGDDDDDDGLEARIRQRKQRVRNVSTAMSDVNKKAFGGLYESYVHEVLLEAHERRVRAGQTSVELATVIPYDLQKELFVQLERAKERESRHEGEYEEAKRRAKEVRTTDSKTAKATAKGKAGDLAQEGAAAGKEPVVPESLANVEEGEEAKVLKIIEQAMLVDSTEQCREFIEMIGVRSLVLAARLTEGVNRSSALTALTKIASQVPSTRLDILKADNGSILGTVMNSLGSSVTVFDSILGKKIDAERGYQTQAKISAAHLIGSLALTKGNAGATEREKLARNRELVGSLERLSGGAKNGETEGAARAARRALAVLGVNKWEPKVPGQRGLRILSIDGGGTRALMTFEMLKHLKKITGCEVHEMFDIIGGTSTGAIIANALGVLKKPIEEVEELYSELIGKVFAKNPLNSSKMIFTRSYYDTSVFEELLKKNCGTVQLLDSTMDSNSPKVFAVSAVLTPQRSVFTHVFRNYTYPVNSSGSRYCGTEDVPLWVALRSSSAAPTFFSEMRVNGEVHADGAIVANNPSAVALHEAHSMYPDVPIELLVSCGNGVLDTSNVDSLSSNQKEKVASIGWTELLSSIITSATSTEQAHHTLEDLMPEEKYFRFNPPTISVDIDQTDPVMLDNWLREVRTYMEAETERFEHVAQLLRPRRDTTPLGKLRDAIGDEVEYLQYGAEQQ